MELKIIVTQKGKIFEGKAPEIVSSRLYSAMKEAVAFLEREVKKRTPRGVFGAQGGLLASIHGEVMGKGTPFMKGIVASQSKYGEVLERGRTPERAMPPKGSLIRWMQVIAGMDEKQAQRLEFVFRRSIGRRGFEGKQMFEKALNENISKIQAIFDRQGFEIARVLSE